MRAYGLRPFAGDFGYGRVATASPSQRHTRWRKPTVTEFYVERIVGSPSVERDAARVEIAAAVEADALESGYGCDGCEWCDPPADPLSIVTPPLTHRIA